MSARPPSGETDLATLVASMRPVVRPGEYVVVSVDPAAAAAAGDGVEASVREPEGLTLVVRRGTADPQGWPYDLVLGWVTLQVHSALAAVGLTAAVAAALTDEGISCNVLAGYFHDHLLVPAERVSDAVSALEGLSSTGWRGEPSDA